MDLKTDTQTVSRMLAFLIVDKNVGNLKAKAFVQRDMEWSWQIVLRLFGGGPKRFLLSRVLYTFSLTTSICFLVLKQSEKL